MLPRWRDLRTQTWDRPIDATFAWACLLANLAVLPGLGSFAARHRVTGVLQGILALVGAGLCLEWLVSVFTLWSREGVWPIDGGPDLRHGVVGVALFAVAWTWSLLTSLILLRDARPSAAATTAAKGRALR